MQRKLATANQRQQEEEEEEGCQKAEAAKYYGKMRVAERRKSGQPTEAAERRRTWRFLQPAQMLLLAGLLTLASVPTTARLQEPGVALSGSHLMNSTREHLERPPIGGHMSSAQAPLEVLGRHSGRSFSMARAPSDLAAAAKNNSSRGGAPMINGQRRKERAQEIVALDEAAARNKLAAGRPRAPRGKISAQLEKRSKRAAQLIDNKTRNRMTDDSSGPLPSLQSKRAVARQANDQDDDTTSRETSERNDGRLQSSNSIVEEDESASGPPDDNDDSMQLAEVGARDAKEEEARAVASKLKCRVEKDLYLDFEEYRHYTCANCYNQVPPEYFKNKLALVRLEERVVKLRDRNTDELIWSNESQLIRATFKDEEKYDKWRICCHEAVACCHTNARHLPQTLNAQGQLIDDPSRLDACPGTWDGLSCWTPSPVGQLAWRTCPRVAYLLDFEPACRGYVTKQCFPNASWFINRYGHEWSDYSTCSPEGLYKARMLHAAVAYVCEALIVTPALLIIGKFPNRGGNKRIRIMKSLLFYILMNSLIQALQRSFLAAGFFAEYRAGPTRLNDGHHTPKSSATSTAVALTASSAAKLALAPSNSTLDQPAAAATLAVSATAAALIMLTNATSGAPARVSRSSAQLKASATSTSRSQAPTWLLSGGQEREMDGLGDEEESRDAEDALIGHIFERKQPEVGETRDATPSIRRRVRRNVTSSGRGASKRSESAWKAIFCWLLQMASRLVRLMGYAWMFTGGVYLCSALQFAPAEPPVRFIKILFFLTNAFPNLIFFAYVTARTINEPSPLNILLKVPYYWFQGDMDTVEYLCSTQKVCWFEESKSEQIENIADLPNLILVASNVILFIITLVILCRINRPGSTRPETSPFAYFKAAGTLLFLYGGHYFFLAYRPESESCSVDTFMFYAFICIDVVQGIAISIVFCYMTQEGKTVIRKYWRNRQRFLLIRQFTWMGCMKDRDKFAENGYHHSALHSSHRFNQSTRSNHSGCNGNNDNVTEFININDTQVSGQF